MSCCAKTVASSGEQIPAETRCSRFNSTHAKITLIVIGILLICASVTMYFLHVNAVANYVVGAIGGVLALGAIILASCAQAMTCDKTDHSEDIAEDPKQTIKEDSPPFVFPVPKLSTDIEDKCFQLQESQREGEAKEWNLKPSNSLNENHIGLFFKFLYSQNSDLEIEIDTPLNVSPSKKGSPEELNRILTVFAKCYHRDGKLDKKFAFMVLLSDDWGLIYIDAASHTIEYYDSRRTKESLQVEQFLSDLAVSLSKIEGEAYTFVSKIPEPLRTKSSESGYWVCYFLYTRIYEATHQFDEEDKKRFKQFCKQLIAWGKQAKYLFAATEAVELAHYQNSCPEKNSQHLIKLDQEAYGGERAYLNLLFAGYHMTPSISLYKDKPDEEIERSYYHCFHMANVFDKEQMPARQRYVIAKI